MTQVGTWVRVPHVAGQGRLHLTPPSSPGHRDYVCGLKPAQPQPAEQPQPGFPDGPPDGDARRGPASRQRPLRLEKSFLAVRSHLAAPRADAEGASGADEPCPQNQKPTSGGDPADRRAAAHGEGSNPRLWFCNRRQKEKRINPCSAPCCPARQAGQPQPPPGTKSPAMEQGPALAHPHLAGTCVKHNLPGCPQCSQNGWRQGEATLGDRLSHSTHCSAGDPGTTGTRWHGHTQLSQGAATRDDLAVEIPSRRLTTTQILAGAASTALLVHRTSLSPT